MQAVMTSLYGTDLNLNIILANLFILTQIVLQLKSSSEKCILLNELIKESLRSCVIDWSALDSVGIKRSDMSDFVRLTSHISSQNSELSQNVYVFPVPDSKLPVGTWLSETEISIWHSESFNMSGLGFSSKMQLRTINLSKFTDSKNIKADSTSNIQNHESKKAPSRKKLNLSSEVKTPLTNEKMLLAIQDYHLEILQAEGENTAENFIPVSVDPDTTVSHQVSINYDELKKLTILEDPHILE